MCAQYGPFNGVCFDSNTTRIERKMKRRALAPAHIHKRLFTHTHTLTYKLLINLDERLDVASPCRSNINRVRHDIVLKFYVKIWPIHRLTVHAWVANLYQWLIRSTHILAKLESIMNIFFLVHSIELKKFPSRWFSLNLTLRLHKSAQFHSPHRLLIWKIHLFNLVDGKSQTTPKLI